MIFLPVLKMDNCRAENLRNEIITGVDEIMNKEYKNG